MRLGRTAKFHKSAGTPHWTPFFGRPRTGSVEVERIFVGGHTIRMFLNHASGDYSCLVPGKWSYERIESPSRGQLASAVRQIMNRRPPRR